MSITRFRDTPHARDLPRQATIVARIEPPADLTSIELLDGMTEVVSRAAAAILATDRSMLGVRSKADQSPVTRADLASQRIIAEGLARIAPALRLVCEESEPKDRPERLDRTFVLVDPLDGTREFIAGRAEFTVNVAVVDQGVPILGIIAAPALDLVWRGAAGKGAERLRLAPGLSPAQARERAAIATRPAVADGLIAAVSRSHLDSATKALVERLAPVSQLECGSALKFCRVAEGAADVYPRLGPTSEWDVAAGHAIVVAAGGLVAGPNRQSLVYGRPEVGFIIPAFVAWGDPLLAARFEAA
jgi:3'(2'), 5'-bisphosphate nucleotidase